MEHIVSKLYDQWDLQVNFKEDNWCVELVGFLYSAEYDKINEAIACGGVNLSDIVAAVTRNPQIQPTASLDPQWIADCYGIGEDAEVSVNH